MFFRSPRTTGHATGSTMRPMSAAWARIRRGGVAAVVFTVPVSVLSLVAAPPALAGDWPQILGPGRNGMASADEKLADRWPAEGPRIVWRRPVGTGYAGVAVRGDRVYLFHRRDGEERLEAIDAVTGRTLWQDGHPTSFSPQVGGGDGPLCVPVVHGDAVITFGAQGVLSCHAAVAGELRWRRQTHREFGGAEGYFGAGSTPLVVGDKVIVNVGGTRGESGIVAFSLANGETSWTATREPASYSSPVATAVDGKPHVVMVTRYQCLLLEASAGEVRWQFPFGMRGPTVNAAAPVLFALEDRMNRLIVTAAYGIGSACGPFDARSFRRDWEGTESLATQYCTPISLGGHLYAIDGRDDTPPADFVCIDAKTGRVAWRERGFGYGNLVAADGKIVAAKTDGEIVLVRPTPEGLRAVSRARPLDGTLRALPAVAAGRLFVRDDTTLACLEVGP